MTVVAEILNANGARLEFGTFTLDPASIADGAQGAEAVTVNGAEAGDLVFCECQGLDASLAYAGSKVTDADEVTVYINNDSGGAVNGAEKTWSYMLVKLA